MRTSMCCCDLPPAVPVPCKPDLITRARISPKELQRWYQDTAPVVTSLARDRWTDFLNKCPERYQIEVPREDQGQCCTVSCLTPVLFTQSGYFEPHGYKI
ncbi:hypothetical protein ElyMa_006601300 [Elysia marginata]|uniref:Uncharacterized protein n=1 Tax=Elysia marginata TaxID=1093978 RepID=A0AAV4IEX3_9GAST|nr:hypothetical protein ElyMa_006601300 [Elysia marginata]